MNMTALDELLKSQGWTPVMRKRYHQTYVYAAQRRGKDITEIYIAPQSRLSQYTEAQVLDKLKKK